VGWENGCQFYGLNGLAERERKWVVVGGVQGHASLGVPFSWLFVIALLATLSAFIL